MQEMSYQKIFDKGLVQNNGNENEAAKMVLDIHTGGMWAVWDQEKIDRSIQTILRQFGKNNQVITNKKIAPITNVLNGKSKQSARNYLYRLVNQYTKGVYSDTFWQQIQAIWKSFTENGVDWDMTRSSQYFKDEKGNPIRKEWYFKISFLNNRQRPTEIMGTITAAGAGSVEHPLDKYDVTVVMF